MHSSKRRTALHGMRTWTQASRKLNPYCKKHCWNPFRYYDRNKPVTLQCDTSLKGTQSLHHPRQPSHSFCKQVSHRHRDTICQHWEGTPSHHVYGCEKFHTYLYGRTFTIERDHKLLEMISMKNLIAAPARLQRMLLQTATVWHDHYIQTRQGNVPGWCPQPSSLHGLTHRSSSTSESMPYPCQPL